MTEQSSGLSKSPAPPVPWLGSVFDPFAGFMTRTAGVSLFVMMVMMTAHVIGRKIGHPVPGAFEASEQLMVIVFSFPLAEIGLRKSHILFELATRRLSAGTRRLLEILAHGVGLVLFFPLTWKAWQVAWKYFVMGEYRQGVIDFPIWPFRIALAVGLTVFVAQMVISLVRDWKQRRS